jgi:predicted enzyme related to lactoylglutathione lyase
MNIDQRMPRPVVHLELHTGDQEAASAFYSRREPDREGKSSGG